MDYVDEDIKDIDYLAFKSMPKITIGPGFQELPHPNLKSLLAISNNYGFIVAYTGKGNEYFIN
jgi:hypothetical protein